MVTTYSTRVSAPNFNGDCEPTVYDVATLKLPGRGVETDSRRTLRQPIIYKDKIPKKSSIMSCKSHTLIGTLNVRTIREQYKRLELANTFLSSKIEILGIQEHRIVHQEKIKIH